MKKALYSITLSFLFIIPVVGQSNEGNNWILGYPPNPDPSFPAPYLGGTWVNFGMGTPDTGRFITDAGMLTSGTISGDNGNLLFYSNGCRAYNFKHEIMPNGDVLGGPGEVFECCCNDPLFRAGHYAQWMIALPWPKNPHKYKLIQAWQTELFKTSDLLLEATVDMELESGLGDAIEKNNLISSGVQFTNFLMANRHGNGIDWWITIPEWRTKKYWLMS
jgi:hypothetical protein